MPSRPHSNGVALPSMLCSVLGMTFSGIRRGYGGLEMTGDSTGEVAAAETLRGGDEPLEARTLKCARNLMMPTHKE